MTKLAMRLCIEMDLAHEFSSAGPLERGDFYIICPDNEATRDVDEKRIQWNAEDLIKNRPALSRWHSDFNELCGRTHENDESELTCASSGPTRHAMHDWTGFDRTVLLISAGPWLHVPSVSNESYNGHSERPME